jgi:flagellar basal-body rod protein FlgF
MLKGIYISASGMLPKATRQEAIANNLANTEVPGFKRDSLFLREMQQAKKRLSGDYPDWRINRFEGIWTDLKQGALRHTGDMFDVALNDKGFFALRTPAGVQYTRNGNFSKNSEGLLTTALGHPVLDENGADIAIPEQFQVPIIDESGVVRGRDESTGEDTVIARLQVVDFPDLYDPIVRAQSPYQAPLQKSPEGYFTAQPGAVSAQAETISVSQGFLEEANVSPIIEMVKMIDIFRSYEADQKAIQIQDSTLDRAVNDVGMVRR